MQTLRSPVARRGFAALTLLPFVAPALLAQTAVPRARPEAVGMSSQRLARLAPARTQLPGGRSRFVTC